MQAIEKEAAGGAAAAAGRGAGAGRAGHRFGDMFKPPLLQRLLVGCWVADHDQHADLRLRDLPAAVLPAPGPDHHQLARPIRWCCRSRRWSAARVGAYIVRRDRTALEHHRRLCRHHRRGLYLCPLRRGVRSDHRAVRRLRADRRDLHPDRAAVRRLHARTVPDRDPPARQRHLQHASAAAPPWSRPSSSAR